MYFGCRLNCSIWIMLFDRLVPDDVPIMYCHKNVIHWCLEMSHWSSGCYCSQPTVCIHYVWAATAATTITLVLEQLESFSFSALSQLTVFSVSSENSYPFFALILFLLRSPSHASTPSYSFPSSLILPLFSWSLHSTPPLQTAHKRAESTAPDLWQTFHSSGPFSHS